MEREGKISSLVIVPVGLVLVLGFLAGYWVRGSGWSLGKPEEAGKKTSLSPSGSRVIKSVSYMVDGKLKSVSGETVVIEDAGETLSFRADPATRVVRFSLPKPPPVNRPEEATNAAKVPTPAPPVEISLKEINVGDRVAAILADSPQGLKALNITVSVQE